MRRALVLLAACSSSPPAPAPAPPTSPQTSRTSPPAPTPPVIAPVIADASLPVACAPVEGKEVEGVDLDGDGDLDRMTRGSSDMFGNAEFVLWRVGAGCPERLGTIEAWMFDEPRCAEPPTGGQVCRLTANRRMMHDDYQEYFWVLDAGGFIQAGSGRYIPGRHSKSP